MDNATRELNYLFQNGWDEGEVTPPLTPKQRKRIKLKRGDETRRKLSGLSRRKQRRERQRMEQERLAQKAFERRQRMAGLKVHRDPEAAQEEHRAVEASRPKKQRWFNKMFKRRGDR